MSYLPAGVNVYVTGRRVVATFIDGFVCGVLYTLINGIFGTNPAPGTSRLSFSGLSTGENWGWLLVVALYYTLMEGLLGQTVGKMLCGIRVISESTGRPPGPGAALLRTILRVIDGVAGYLLGFIIVLASSRRRRLGDMVANTLVIRA